MDPVLLLSWSTAMQSAVYGGSISKQSDIYAWWILVDPRTPRCTQGGFWWIRDLIHWTPHAWNVFCFYLRLAGSSWILMYARRILCSGSRALGWEVHFVYWRCAFNNTTNSREVLNPRSLPRCIVCIWHIRSLIFFQNFFQWLAVGFSFFAYVFVNIVLGVLCTNCTGTINAYWSFATAITTPQYWLSVFLAVTVGLIPRFVCHTILFKRGIQLRSLNNLWSKSYSLGWWDFNRL